MEYGTSDQSVKVITAPFRAKREFEQLDPDSFVHLGIISTRADMIKHLVENYSAEAEVKRRGRVAQKLVPHKNA